MSLFGELLRERESRRVVEQPRFASIIDPDRLNVVIFDTDGDGRMGGIIAYDALRKAGIPVRIYSHFVPVKEAENSKLPPTNAAAIRLDRVIEYLKPPYNSNIVTIDIPPPAELDRFTKNVKAIEDLTSVGNSFIVFDQLDHAPLEAWQRYRAAGAILRLFYDGMSVKLGIPNEVGVYDPHYEKFALLGSASDFDENVASRVSKDEEEFAAAIFDPVMKFVAYRVVEEAGYRAEQFGESGAVVAYVVERLGADFDAFVRWVMELESRIPPNQRLPRAGDYVNLGHVVVGDAIKNNVPGGLYWKWNWWLTYSTGAMAGVVLGEQGGQFVIIAAPYWRNKSKVAPIIEEVAQEYARRLGATLTGHFGARGIGLPRGVSREEAWEVAMRIGREIQQRIETNVLRLVSETTRVLLGIGVTEVQRIGMAVNADLSEILRRIARVEEALLETANAIRELVRQNQEMYRHYLELKERQVSLLEQLQRQQPQQGQNQNRRVAAD